MGQKNAGARRLRRNCDTVDEPRSGARSGSRRSTARATSTATTATATTSASAASAASAASTRAASTARATSTEASAAAGATSTATAATAAGRSHNGLKRGLLISGQERTDSIEVLRAGVVVFGHGRRVIGVGLGGRINLGLDLGLLVVAQAGDGRSDGLKRRRSLHAAAGTALTSARALALTLATALAATSTGTARGASATRSTSTRLGDDIRGNETEGEGADGRDGFQG